MFLTRRITSGVYILGNKFVKLKPDIKHIDRPNKSYFSYLYIYYLIYSRIYDFVSLTKYCAIYFYKYGKHYVIQVISSMSVSNRTA